MSSRARFLGLGMFCLAVAGVAACGDRVSSPAELEPPPVALDVEPGPCPTSLDPADTSCQDQGPAASAVPSPQSSVAPSSTGFNIAYINDNFDLAGFSSVQSVVAARGLGTVTRLTIQNVLDGALRTGNYDVIFFARHYGGPASGGTAFPFTRLPGAIRDELDLALQAGCGIITEWQGGSPVWSTLRTDDFNYYQITDTNGNLWNWFQGTVDRGDCCSWIPVPLTFTTADPLHPVTQGMAASFSIPGVEFCYRVANLDPTLSAVTTLTDAGGAVRPAISVGQRHDGNVVLWTCDWGDNGGNDLNVQNWIENSIRYAAKPLEVDIDIKPGSFPNSINPRSMGVVPVAILGSADFDVTDVDVTTLEFGPAGATPAHDLMDPVTYADHLQDVNDDGFTDLVSHYRQKETGLQPGDTEACIEGATTGGRRIEGCDSVNVLDPGA